MSRVRYLTNGIPLRIKLVLSYLGVALGAILLLIVVVSLAVQSYFYTTEIGQLKARADYVAQGVSRYYAQFGSSWNNISGQITTNYSPDLFVLVDMQHYVRGEAHIPVGLNDFSVLPTEMQNALIQSLQGQEVEGTFQSPDQSTQGPSFDRETFSGLYVSVPVRDANGQLIGALLLEDLNHYPSGLSPSEFLPHVDQAILIAGLGIALVVVIFSLLLARGLTKPLVSLTEAAEQMKSGNYSRRVEPPGVEDEMGRLALTFNAMADKIEADLNELRKQEQMRRDLVANIAHDLVTPLTAIQGYSEAIADNVIAEPADRQETAQLIGREVQRLRRLVSEMQNMSSLDTGRIRLDVAPLDMYTLVEETLAVIRPECEQAGITLQNEIEPGAPLVLADSDRITQVLLNLLDNARRHTPEGGSIQIGAIVQKIGKTGKAEKTEETRAGYLAIWVKDTGTGISPEDLPHIFERFYRVDRSRTGSSGGSGLGLAIVRAIIEAHGGRIWAESTPGAGTCIWVILPTI